MVLLLSLVLANWSSYSGVSSCTSPLGLVQTRQYFCFSNSFFLRMTFSSCWLLSILTAISLVFFWVLLSSCRQLSTCWCRFLRAQWIAISLFPSTLLKLMLLLTKHLHTSRWPPAADQNRQFCPFESWWFTSAPFSISMRAHSRCPLETAKNRGVCLLQSLVLRSYLQFLSRQDRSLGLPFLAMQQSTFWEYLSSLRGSTPFSRNLGTTSAASSSDRLEQAQKKGVCLF